MGGGGGSPFGDIISILIAMTTNQLQKKTFHAAGVSVKMCNTLGHQTLKSLASYAKDFYICELMQTNKCIALWFSFISSVEHQSHVL